MFPKHRKLEGLLNSFDVYRHLLSWRNGTNVHKGTKELATDSARSKTKTPRLED